MGRRADLNADVPLDERATDALYGLEPVYEPGASDASSSAEFVDVDNDGWLYYLDRSVDTIKHKGYRVASSEIETVLQEHPAVIASCVVGIPDEKVGERIKAFVVLKEDVKGVSAYDLLKWCRERLAPYKIPQYIEFRDMLPKSKVGKLLRREMRAEERKRFEKTD